MSAAKQISCGEAVARLYDFLDREGSAASVEEVERHLNMCRHCCDRFAFEVSLWQVVKTKGQEACCPEGLKAKVQQLLIKY